MRSKSQIRTLVDALIGLGCPFRLRVGTPEMNVHMGEVVVEVSAFVECRGTEESRKLLTLADEQSFDVVVGREEFELIALPIVD